MLLFNIISYSIFEVFSNYLDRSYINYNNFFVLGMCSLLYLCSAERKTLYLISEYYQSNQSKMLHFLHRLLSKGMSNIYIKGTTEKK